MKLSQILPVLAVSTACATTPKIEEPQRTSTERIIEAVGEINRIQDEREAERKAVLGLAGQVNRAAEALVRFNEEEIFSRAGIDRAKTTVAKEDGGKEVVNSVVTVNVTKNEDGSFEAEITDNPGGFIVEIIKLDGLRLRVTDRVLGSRRSSRLDMVGVMTWNLASDSNEPEWNTSEECKSE